MKFQFTTSNDPKYWEDAEREGDETMEQAAKRVVDYFNATLRPGEKPRKLLSVRELPERIAIVKMLKDTVKEMVADSTDEDGEYHDEGDIGRIQGMEEAVTLIEEKFGRSYQ